jgi:O-antigen biosynthesis protein
MRKVKRSVAGVAAAKRLRTALFRAGDRRFCGYVLDPADLSRRFFVEISVDGYPVRVMRADGYVHHLALESIGDGRYGFTASIDEKLLSCSTIVTASVANLGTAVGSPVILQETAGPAFDLDGPGQVRWLGRLHFCGWLAENQEPASVKVRVDGLLIDHLRPSGWSHLVDDIPRALQAFDLHLPSRFADGDVHQLAIETTAGENFIGSPMTFLTFRDDLHELVTKDAISSQENLRAELYDRLIPASVPMTHYSEWRQRFSPDSGVGRSVRCAVVMTGTAAMEETLGSLEQQTDADWVAAVVAPSDVPVCFELDPVRRFLNGDGAGCEYILFGLSGTLLVPNALQRFGHAFSRFENADAVYGDIDIKAADGSIWPIALSAFDYERMLSQGYCAHLFAIRTSVALRSLAGGATDLYRLFNSIFDCGEICGEKVVHLPGSVGTLPDFDQSTAGTVLAAASRVHLQSRNIEAKTASTIGTVFPSVHVARRVEPQSITVIIPTRDRRDLLEACIETIQPAVERLASSEILAVENNTTDADTLRYLSDIDGRLARVVRVPGAFNLARLINCGARVANGDVLCIVHSNVEAMDDEWLDEMLSQIVEESVGAVGALLLRPSGVIQHGGVVLGTSFGDVGTSFAASHAFTNRIDGDLGYGGLLKAAHECSAVTGACMLTRRLDYDKVGGMDELRFPIDFNDVDYCLKLRALGRRVVFTPHARLRYRQSTSRWTDRGESRKTRFERELGNLRSKWGTTLAADPYYSPILSREAVPFSGLAWPPGSTEPRVNSPPVAVTVPVGF